MADKFPVTNLSPPVLAAPIYSCAEAVYVSGFVPNATVKIYATNGGVEELLAEVVPPFGFVDVIIKRQMNVGESISATQTVGTQTSPHSIQPVIVASSPLSLIRITKPVVAPNLYQCGVIVPVDKLVPGTRLHVYEGSTELANEAVAGTWHAAFTPPLHTGGVVTAEVIACEGHDDIPSLTGDDDPRITDTGSIRSDPVIVQSAPSPVPPPKPEAASMVPGNDTVTLSGLFVGASVEIFDNGTKVTSGWFANGDRNYFPLSSRLTNASKITATQKLCTVSNPSDPVIPTGKLEAPVVLSPICPESRFVAIRGTTINATVVILRGNAIVGYAGAAPGDVIVGLGGTEVLHAGDVITAVQYMGSTISPPSKAITVVSTLPQPVVEILGGEPFFLPKGGEQAIDGPVFPRGRGAGPLIHIKTCCSKEVTAQILDPNKNVIAKLELTEAFPGYFTGTWPWTSTTNWPVPNGIPVGRYTLIAHSGCNQKDAEVSFYVIFNPADVNGPPRFSFDGTAVWFGTGTNTTHALHYYLRQSDMRVFSIALNAVSGMTDSYDAAIATARAEEKLFIYTLDYHTQDVLDMILHFKEAQCADDASCLTSLLRAVGIPAHNVTADAGLETGAGGWTFDTWVEFLATHEMVTDWRIFHPHQYKGMSPESRGEFGTTKNVAMKESNDIIVMANEDWPFSALDDGTAEVSYTRNSCNEPNEILTKAPWIGELCEDGYWPIPHWDCSLTHSRALSSDGFRIREGDLEWGGRVAGNIRLVNNLDEPRFGTIIVDLISSRVESKRISEDCFDSICKLIKLDRGKSFTLAFDLKIPAMLPPYHDLALLAHMDGVTIATQILRLKPCFTCKITEPKEKLPVYALGKQYKICAAVTNISQHDKKDVEVELHVPFALRILGKAKYRIECLKPRESHDFEWKVEAISALEFARFKVVVATANGGSLVIQHAFKVVGPPPIVEVPPATR